MFFFSHLSNCLGAWKDNCYRYTLGTEKDKVFPIVFSAFYLPLALSTVKNPQTHLAEPDKLPLTSKMKLFVSFCYVASSSNGELEAFFDIVDGWFRHHISPPLSSGCQLY